MDCKKDRRDKPYRDEEYTECGICPNTCDRAIKCNICGKTKGVFYKGSRYDAFFCAKCFYVEEKKREQLF